MFFINLFFYINDNIYSSKWIVFPNFEVIFLKQLNIKLKYYLLL